MILTQDMRDFLSLLHRHRVEYLLVGGVAVNIYGYVRATQDIEFLIRPSEVNAQRLADALEVFGFGKAGLPLDDFAHEGLAVHLGAEPNRIDLVTSISAISVAEAFTDPETVELEGIEVAIISREALIPSKERSPRLRDLADAEELRKLDQS